MRRRLGNADLGVHSNPRSISSSIAKLDWNTSLGVNNLFASAAFIPHPTGIDADHEKACSDEIKAQTEANAVILHIDGSVVWIIHFFELDSSSL